ncbi:Leucine-rich receptor-like protein kinase family protein [Prunus dulcis]|uniref:Leucine-rich receptor-like protein kinase family protein n=1 Tax=Prunus dulcis TaxID=3755 RepID=A0A5H2XR20_PRUDU|nr:Leucine-rich receptor-like protein kinase family protein [Prunus dulcis]
MYVSIGALCGEARLHVPPCQNSTLQPNSRKARTSKLKYIIPGIISAILLVAFVSIVSHLELLSATNGFDESNLLGTGGFGSVYKGTISGVLRRELGNLSNLESLLLFRNSFVGNIPHELGRCKKLVNLELYVNQFTRGNSSELGNLFLTGTIPSELGSLRSLQVLTMHSNKFTGEIPSFLTNLTNQTYLSMSINF